MVLLCLASICLLFCPALRFCTPDMVGGMVILPPTTPGVHKGARQSKAPRHCETRHSVPKSSRMYRQHHLPCRIWCKIIIITTFRTTTPPSPPACCSSRKVWGLIPTAAQKEQRKVCQAKPNEGLSSRHGQYRVLLQSRYPPRQCLGRERAFVTQKEIPRIGRKLHLA
jgi:hypothetical protein